MDRAGLRLLVWATVLATLFGLILGALLYSRGWPVLLAFPVAFIGVLLTILVGGRAVLATAEHGARAVLQPSGSSVPYRKEHSRVIALEAQGLYPEALAEYERIAAQGPNDPDLCMRIARLLRDRLGRWEDAATWMRKAREGRDIGYHADTQLAREIVELFRRAETPRRAVPELARVVAIYPGTDAARWAQEELGVLRGETWFH